ncbi:hypothetical protein NQ317_013234, partial [Molorchus minor]
MFLHQMEALYDARTLPRFLATLNNRNAQLYYSPLFMVIRDSFTPKLGVKLLSAQTAHNIHWTSILHPKLIRTSMDSKAGVRQLPSYHPDLALPHSPRFTKNIKVQNVLRFSINSRQSVFNTVYSVRCLSCLKGQGKLLRSCPNNISINSHKKHGRWNEKMAETGQEEGKQNIRIEGAL